jgi:hypothetical protein
VKQVDLRHGLVNTVRHYKAHLAKMEQPNVSDVHLHDANGAQQHDHFTSAEECSAIVDSEEKHWPQEEGDTVALIHTP